MGPRSEQRGEGIARFIDRRPCFPAGSMDAGGIPKVLLDIRPHGCERFGRERRGGVVIEVNHREQFSDAPRTSSWATFKSEMRCGNTLPNFTVGTFREAGLIPLNP